MVMVAPRAWPRRELLGLPVDLVCREDVLKTVPRLVSEGGSNHLVALNPIKVMRAQEEPDLRAGIEEAALVYPDAVGITWALRTLYGDRIEKLPGCELMLDLFGLASRERYRVYLVGAKAEVLAQVERKIIRDHPGIELAGSHHGYFDDADRDAVAAGVVAARPDLLFVAMGAHRQETFVREVERRGGVPLMMTVGGSFDAYAEAVPRPPRWMLRLHLEWFYRLVRQPFRAPRMAALPRFACRVLALRYRPNSSR